MHTVSWKEFFTLIGLSCLGWYAWVVFKYFSGSWLTRGLGKRGQKTGIGLGEMREEKPVDSDLIKICSIQPDKEKLKN